MYCLLLTPRIGATVKRRICPALNCGSSFLMKFGFHYHGFSIHLHASLPPSNHRDIRNDLLCDMCVNGLHYVLPLQMSRTNPPELKKFMEKACHIKLNGNRHIQGTLRGFDPYMNLALEDAVQIMDRGVQIFLGKVVVRGDSVIIIEAMERLI